MQGRLQQRRATPAVPVTGNLGALLALIWVSANLYLTLKGYAVTRGLFNNSLTGGGSISTSLKNKIISKAKADKDFNNALSTTLKNINGNTVSNLKISFAFTTGDLYYGIHKADMYVTGTKANGKWTLSIKLTDTFDFDGYWSGIKLASLANNLGYYLQTTGLLTTFPWNVTFSYTI